MNKTVFFTGGGTAGHVYPGLSVAEALLRKMPDARVIWIGSKKGMEEKIVRASGIEFIGIASGKLRRYFSFRNFTDIFRIKAGLIKAFFIMGRYRPAVVFSKGGFVSVPPVIAAGLRKIPVYSHESDVTPGLATRINSRFSEKILVSYEKTMKYITAGKAVLTGNPLRSAIFSADSDNGRKIAGAGNKKIIMVLGGSQGALQINRLIEQLLPELAGKYFIIHQTGKHDFNSEIPDGYMRREYINEELPDLMAAADIIISRAGASTLWETAALGKPSILIPLGTGASRGDQAMNADVFREAGASVVLEGFVTAEQLKTEIDRIMNDDKLKSSMAEAALQLVKENPAEIISDLILERLK